MEIIHHPETGCFKAYDQDHCIGTLCYTSGGDVLAATSTYVDETYRGRGVARSLLNAMVEYAELNGLKIRPVCGYVVAMFREHPQQYATVSTV